MRHIVGRPRWQPTLRDSSASAGESVGVHPQMNATADGPAGLLSVAPSWAVLA